MGVGRSKIKGGLMFLNSWDALLSSFKIHCSQRIIVVRRIKSKNLDDYASNDTSIGTDMEPSISLADMEINRIFWQLPSVTRSEQLKPGNVYFCQFYRSNWNNVIVFSFQTKISLFQGHILLFNRLNGLEIKNIFWCVFSRIFM